MLRPRATARKTPTWPTPTPEQVEVVLLGTYHMTEPGLDAVNVSTDDVFADDWQLLVEFPQFCPVSSLPHLPLDDR